MTFISIHRMSAFVIKICNDVSKVRLDRKLMKCNFYILAHYDLEEKGQTNNFAYAF